MNDGEKKFKDNYKILNNAQKKAVDAIEGPVMVVAGPGTGKTQVLTLRIANILRKTDISPSNILVLTFTEAASASLRRRLASFVGSAAYAVEITTFHGFGNEIIKRYPEYFPRIIGARQINEVEQVALIEEAINSLKLDILKPFGDAFLYVRSVVSAIGHLKREGVGVEDFSSLSEEAEKDFEIIPDLYHDRGVYKGRMKGKYSNLKRQIEKNKELSFIYKYYQDELLNRRFYDYDDMIMETLGALKAEPDLLRLLQEEYQYILIDEHQDTNNAQNRLIELLANFHNSPNIFVVGDEKQAIFRFQGASLENFYYFKNLYPDAELIILKKNYRSQQIILDAADSLLPGKEKLITETSLPKKPISFYFLPTSDCEVYFLAKDIKAKVDNGTPAEEIAILYRDNKDAFPIARALEKMRIPVSIESDEELFHDPLIKRFLIFLEAINFFGQDDKLSEALHIDWFKIDPVLIFGLINEAHQKKDKILDILAKCSDKSVKFFYSNLIEHKILAQNESLLTFFEKAVRGSGLLKNIIKRQDSWEKFEMLNSLFDEVKSLVNSHPEASLKDFFDYLETIKKHKILLRNKKTLIKEGSVRLMTVHRSKGLEFDFVYIANTNDGHFGGRRKVERLPLLPRVFSLIDRPDNSFDFGLDADDDERRLFYVAITRAREEVIITGHHMSSEGRENLPSSYLSEIDSRLIEEKPVKRIEDDFNENKHLFLFELDKHPEQVINDRGLVAELFRRQGMSVTALNNYLECPWKYFYQNLIRLPSAPIKSASYGNAVHRALRDYFNHFREDDPGVDSLLASFKNYLNDEILNTEDYEESLSRGFEALKGWYENYKDSWNNNVITEFRISDVEVAPQVRLTGILDKIEFLDSSQKVNVVDYKSRAPMSRNEMMGLTKNASGDIYRQLVFYKILLDYFENRKYEMVSAEIDFIQPDSKGKYKKEKFEISDEEKKDLEELIKKVADEIINLKFWNKRCSDDKCYFCSLRAMLD